MSQDPLNMVGVQVPRKVCAGKHFSWPSYSRNGWCHLARSALSADRYFIRKTGSDSIVPSVVTANTVTTHGVAPEQRKSIEPPINHGPDITGAVCNAARRLSPRVLERGFVIRDAEKSTTGPIVAIVGPNMPVTAAGAANPLLQHRPGRNHVAVSVRTPTRHSTNEYGWKRHLSSQLELRKCIGETRACVRCVDFRLMLHSKPPTGWPRLWTTSYPLSKAAYIVRRMFS